MYKVSIIIPVVRPEKAARCIQAMQEIMLNGGEIISWDVSLLGHERYLRKNFSIRMASGDEVDVEVLDRGDTDAIGCPRMVANLVAQAQGDHILFLGDDTIPQPGFLSAALESMATLPDGWGLVCLNDGIHEGRFATHWLASKKLLDHLPGGEFFHTGYKHCFCDKELTDIARELGRYVYAPEAKIIHDHPHVTGEAYDDGYKRAYKMDSYLHDQRLYWSRKRERNAVQGVKLAIGFPLVDADVPAQFFLSVLCMAPPEYTLLVPTFPAGKFCDSVASVRNDLVTQALEAGCTHLLMCDTDQIYPADTVEKLLSHGKDIVGAAVHRRWPPFDLILLRGELGRYTHVPESECYSGDLVPVDATGTGCVLFDMRVFLDVPAPWFEFGQHEGKPVGEDIMFFSKARQAGFEAYVDTSVEVEHLTTLRVNRGMRSLYRKTNKHEFAQADQQ